MEKVLVLGASAGILMPIFYPLKRKIVLNFGGLDWDRSKWNFFAKKFVASTNPSILPQSK
mgnify:CR=1 FL=1